MIKGTQIIYIPRHVKVIEGQEEMHPDVEAGFVFGKIIRSHIFCRYWSKHSPDELRTKSCSESTPVDCILIKDTRPQDVVDKVIKEIDRQQGMGGLLGVPNV